MLGAAYSGSCVGRPRLNGGCGPMTDRSAEHRDCRVMAAMRRPGKSWHTSSRLRRWPLAPRPFDEEAFGSWFGRVASCYRMSVDRTWEANELGPLPSLTNAGWMLFAPLNDITLRTLANLARLDVARLA